MGAWGIANFDNDRACDWTLGLAQVTDLSLVERAVSAVFAAEYLDADIGCDAVAAIETLARLNGRFGTQNSYTELVDAWVLANPQVVPEALVEQSKQALDLIVAKESELAVLWAETDDHDAWQQEVANLKVRLGPAVD